MSLSEPHSDLSIQLTKATAPILLWRPRSVASSRNSCSAKSIVLSDEDFPLLGSEKHEPPQPQTEFFLSKSTRNGRSSRCRLPTRRSQVRRDLINLGYDPDIATRATSQSTDPHCASLTAYHYTHTAAQAALDSLSRFPRPPKEVSPQCPVCVQLDRQQAERGMAERKRTEKARTAMRKRIATARVRQGSSDAPNPRAKLWRLLSLHRARSS